ncbi:PAS domain S-box-containing protein [Saccharopolyspora kobensis]|uniref:PAS domain S-box-containing protein n=1 Tax=Saccharopolyspora kobensis TaxID=146035 RepID=A0A1H6ARW0_9PSEU|nr:PAS domain-containing protein [Saccharopolyspora kobensis]SEG51152.1 PAS domain S-box-containing protein [Saccharopolyspora kobensis]SFE77152.1 PAS domain S-box-containing protein [Saccharopolyspora kobensis]
MDPESCGPPHAVDWRREAITWRNRMILLLDHLPTPIALCEADGGILLANPAMAAEWGLLPGQMRGRNALDFFRPRAKARLHPIAEAVRLHRRSRYPVEVSWTPPSGVERYGEVDVTPVSDTADAPPALMLVLRVRGERVETSPEEPAPPASEIEARILALAAGGDTTARIAKAVGLTVDGVNYHLAQLARRWNVRGRTALVARAYALGVLDPEAWPPAPTEPA